LKISLIYKKNSETKNLLCPHRSCSVTTMFNAEGGCLTRERERELIYRYYLTQAIAWEH